jgi:hypothetical protein
MPSGAAGAADPAGAARRAGEQDRHAVADERHSVFAADRRPWRYLPRYTFPPRSTIYRPRGPLGICRNQKQLLNQSILWCAVLLQKLRELELVNAAMPRSLPLMADK